MTVKITPRITRSKQKTYHTLEWGKKVGQRIATGIFTNVNPVNSIQKYHNKEALRLLEIKKAQIILEYQAIGTEVMPFYRYHFNFLDYYTNMFIKTARLATDI